MLADFDRGLFRALVALVTLVSVSTIVLWRGYRLPGMSALDALYFSTETVATVGYGDFNFVDQDPWLRMWAIFLMLAGITTTAMLMAFLADMLINRVIVIERDAENRFLGDACDPPWTRPGCRTPPPSRS